MFAIGGVILGVGIIFFVWDKKKKNDFKKKLKKVVEEKNYVDDAMRMGQYLALGKALKREGLGVYFVVKEGYW